jgi:hypothetical protein
VLKSRCCDAEAIIVMSPDFPGDDIKTMVVGTCHYQCKQCGEACDIKEET